MSELNYNLHVLSDIRKFLEMDEEAEKEGKQALVTYPKPRRFAFDYFVIEGHLLKLPEEHKMELLEVYRALDLISMYLDHYIETKYGILSVTSGVLKVRRSIREILSGHLIPATESLMKELLNTMKTPCNSDQSTHASRNVSST